LRIARQYHLDTEHGGSRALSFADGVGLDGLDEGRDGLPQAMTGQRSLGESKLTGGPLAGRPL
jgi:hypothetical protein